uniref:DUF3456 domain-containing protein n=1 Tax=Panagrolaimus sp. PS1159 TaxID=55785 RepID=A0AC35FT34_9BILA
MKLFKVLVLFFINYFIGVLSTEETSVKCGACMLVVREFEKAIKAIDPKKMTTVGSFRVDPKGNQKGLVEIPFARSEAHLQDVLEDVCEKTKKYTQTIHPVTGKKTYIHEEIIVEYKRIPGMSNKLHSACIDFVDDNDSEIIKFMQKEEVEDPLRDLCHEKLGICTSVDVSPFPDPTPSDDYDGNTKESDNLENDEL